MSDNHFYALKQVVDAIDNSVNPQASFAAMIVFFMSATTKLDLDQAWTAFSVASTRIEGGKVHVYDETLPDEAAPKVRRGRTRSPA